MSVLSDIIRDRKEWATSRTSRSQERRLKLLEFLLALSLLFVAFYIYTTGPRELQQVIITTVDSFRSLGQSVMQLFT